MKKIEQEQVQPWQMRVQRATPRMQRDIIDFCSVARRPLSLSVAVAWRTEQLGTAPHYQYQFQRNQNEVFSGI